MQFWILWSYGFTSDWQYIPLTLSVTSLAWGATNGLLYFISGEEKLPELSSAIFGLYPILTQVLTTVSAYSLLYTFLPKSLFVLLPFLFAAFFILSMLFSDDFFSFVFNLMSSFISPVLSTNKNEQIRESSSGFSSIETQTLMRLEAGHKIQKKKNKKRQLLLSIQFYGLNKFITSLGVLSALICLMITVNSQDKNKEIGVSTFQKNNFSRSSFAEQLDCHGSCTAYSEVKSCILACEKEINATGSTGNPCHILCKSNDSLDAFLHIKKNLCERHLPLYIIIGIIMLLVGGLADSIRTLTSHYKHSLSYCLLFKNSEDETLSTETEREAKSMASNELNGEDESTLSPNRCRAYNIARSFGTSGFFLAKHSKTESISRELTDSEEEFSLSRINMMFYRIPRMIAILGFFLVKHSVIKRAVYDYQDGDIWWSFLGIGCLILPSIPIALKYLQRMISNIKNQNDVWRVKEYCVLLSLTLVYFCGGFVIFALY